MSSRCSDGHMMKDEGTLGQIAVTGSIKNVKSNKMCLSTQLKCNSDLDFLINYQAD